jgi:hypothetical protein
VVLLSENTGDSTEFLLLQETLARALGVKVRQLQSYIQELENYTQGDPPQPLPLLEVKRVWDEQRAKTRNIYDLLRRPFLALTRMANSAEGAALADGSNTQSSAHRCDGDAQGAAGALPPIPLDDRGVVPDGVSATDAQSSAHWSAGDVQNAASPVTLTHGRDSRAVPPQVAPEDRVVPAAYSNPAWSSAQRVAPVLAAHRPCQKRLL